MFETLGNDAERQRLHAGHGLIPVSAVAHHSRQVGDFSQPPAVTLPLEFDRERHAKYCSIRPSSLTIA